KRFVELKAHIQGITPKVLTETLRTLERDGLVARTDYEQNPPRVEYELTELGRSLLAPLREIRGVVSARGSHRLRQSARSADDRDDDGPHVGTRGPSVLLGRSRRTAGRCGPAGSVTAASSHRPGSPRSASRW